VGEPQNLPVLTSLSLKIFSFMLTVNYILNPSRVPIKYIMHPCHEYVLGFVAWSNVTIWKLGRTVCVYSMV